MDHPEEDVKIYVDEPLMTDGTFATPSRGER
jgi:hypothetical protein